jgi:NAD/NADP transhydrogenase beta subunit
VLCDTRPIGGLLLQLVPLAVVCALSPWAIVAVILMLASDRPSNAVWWLVGWTLSTFGLGILIILFLGGYDFSDNTTPSTAACVVQVVLGALLLIAAARFWTRRPARTGMLPAEPKWMDRIDKLSGLWAFLIGAFWINTALVIAAGIDTLRAELSSGQSIAVFAVFTLITLSVQGALILYAYLMPARAEIGLRRIREWITRNQQVALAVVALVLAVWFASQGISGLWG